MCFVVAPQRQNKLLPAKIDLDVEHHIYTKRECEYFLGVIISASVLIKALFLNSRTMVYLFFVKSLVFVSPK